MGVSALRLAYVSQHIAYHMLDMGISARIEHLLAPSLPFSPGQHPGSTSTQQTQMMAHQGLGKVKPVGDIADAGGLAQAGEDDAQPRGIAHQSEQIGKTRDSLFGFQLSRVIRHRK